MSKSINILKEENFDKLFSIKDYSSIKEINIFGHRDYNDKIIKEIIKFNKVTQLNITTKSDLNEIANLQSLTSLPLVLDSSWNLSAIDFYISRNKENVIINDSYKFKIENLVVMLDTNILNITIFANDNCEKICNILPIGCENVRIIIESSDFCTNLVKKCKQINLSNLPTTIKKIYIIFKQIDRYKSKNKYNLIEKQLLKETLKENIKIPFDCEFNIFFL